MKFFKKLTSGCGQLSLNCREAVRAQSDQLDRKLPFATRLGLWLHLLICKWCRRYAQQTAFLRQAAGEHPEKFTESGPQKLSPAARERIKQRLDEFSE